MRITTRLTLNRRRDTVITFHIEDGVVTGLYALRNPEKLGRLGEVTTLVR